MFSVSLIAVCIKYSTEAINSVGSNLHHWVLTKYHCGESKTQRKWFLDEKRDGLVDENRINTNQQNKKQQKVYTPKNCSVNLICFKQ